MFLCDLHQCLLNGFRQRWKKRVNMSLKKSTRDANHGCEVKWGLPSCSTAVHRGAVVPHKFRMYCSRLQASLEAKYFQQAEPTCVHKCNTWCDPVCCIPTKRHPPLSEPICGRPVWGTTVCSAWAGWVAELWCTEGYLSVRQFGWFLCCNYAAHSSQH